MKISKVDHTKAAVGKVEDTINGILYVDPTSGRPRENLEVRFRNLNRKAQKLYKIFNSVHEGEKPKEAKYRGMPEAFETALRNYERRLKAKNFIDGDKKLGIEGLNNAVSNVFFKTVLHKNEKTGRTTQTKEIRNCEDVISQIAAAKPQDLSAVEDCLILYLRKSLRPGRECLRTIINEFGTSSASPDINAAVDSFLELLKKDYEKTAQSEQIKRSIENQNLIIQPRSNESGSFLALSGGNGTSKNSLEKQGLQTFLTRFADLDEGKRMDSLRKLRRLNDLFFNAPETGEAVKACNLVDCSDFDVFKAHEIGKSNEGLFVSVPELFRQTSGNGGFDSMQMRLAKEELENDIRRRNMACYRYAVKASAEDENGLFFEEQQVNEFWIHHIEKAVERLLKKLDTNKLFKLKTGYLAEKTWKDLLNLISTKYVALGKAVYNFAMDDLLKPEGDKILGNLSEKVANGLSSFDYERIKADETIQRDISVAIAFAANNFSRVVADISKDSNNPGNEEDYLLWKLEKFDDYLANVEPDLAIKNILQFFGGISSWSENMEIFKCSYPDAGNYEASFIYDIKEILYSLRNESFHFSTAKNETNWNMGLIGNMFAKEAADCVLYEKKKFYSNNLPLFYSGADLEHLMDFLYSKYSGRMSQVPAFNSVCVRKKFPDYLVKYLNCTPNIINADDKDKWLSGLYYAFKEIYYNGFLASGQAKALFEEALNETLNGYDKNDTNKEARAAYDFYRRYKELKDGELGEICQGFMSEYNAQNTGIRKAQSSAAAKKDNRDRALFQHYKMILLDTLGNAFAKYIKRTPETSFLIDKVIVKNEYPDIIPEEQFLPGWKSGMYEYFVKEVYNSPELQKWYIAGRFLNGKVLNSLAGNMRAYIKYVNDVLRRAEQTENSVFKNETASIRKYEKNAEMIDICIRLSSAISNDYHDYFRDEDEYADYLSRYIAYDSSPSMSPLKRLEDFCSNTSEKQGIYMDGKNPILNRNVVMAKLYGPGQVLENVVNPVTKDDISEYYDLKEKISRYRIKGTVISNQEQQTLLDYQRKINRIELRTLTDYGELINELLAQLVSWSFLRERDLLYFQLGFHYLCLNNPDAVKPEQYCKITLKNGTIIDNAILYQIAALYIFGLGLVDTDNNKITGKNMQTSLKLRIYFPRYSAKILEGTNIQVSSAPEQAVYKAGLEVFENTNEHSNIVALRNNIDHFNYYYGNCGSLLDLYSEMFDRFFTYDMKYQKNVINMLENILLRYFVIVKPLLGTGTKNVGNEKTKESAKIDIAEHGISSEVFTYKLSGVELIIDARDKDFKETVARILYYPHEVPDGIIADDRRPRVVNCNGKTVDNKSNRKNNARVGKKRPDSGRTGDANTDRQNNRLTSNPFEELLKDYMK